MFSQNRLQDSVQVYVVLKVLWQSKKTVSVFLLQKWRQKNPQSTFFLFLSNPLAFLPSKNVKSTVILQWNPWEASTYPPTGCQEKAAGESPGQTSVGMTTAGSCWSRWCWHSGRSGTHQSPGWRGQGETIMEKRTNTEENKSLSEAILTLISVMVCSMLSNSRWSWLEIGKTRGRLLV